VIGLSRTLRVRTDTWGGVSRELWMFSEVPGA